MYGVSDAFIEATKQKSRVSKLRGTITTKSGVVIPFDDTNLIKGSLSIDNQCVNGSNFEYGAVYQGQLTFSILDSVDRYTLYDAEVSLTYHLQLADGTFESVPMGVFYISEPNRIAKILSIKAYDNMQKLDISVEDEVYGTVWDLLNHVADKCGVELAQTEEEIALLTNASQLFTFIPDRVDTYRDALAYLAMITCTFATFDREGKLKLVQFGTESVDTFTENERSSSTISDFETYFSGVEARFIAEENWAPYEQYVEGEGLILAMGDNPVVQGLVDVKHEIMEAVMTTLSGVRYVPCNITLAGGNPALDLGDMFTNKHGDVETKSIVTKFVWKYRGSQTIESAGANPRLSGAKSKSEKQLSNAEASIAARDVIVYSYTNTSDMSFQSEEKDIIQMTYSSIVENAKPILIATVQLEMDCDGYAVFRFYVDSVLQENFTLRKYLEAGQHFVTFSFNSTMAKDERAKLVVTAQMEYYESEYRKQQANVITNNNAIIAIADYLKNAEPDTELSWESVNVDTTIPTCTILKNKINAVLFAQGLGASGKWDGTFTFAETVDRLALTGLSVWPLIDNVEKSVTESEVQE